MLLGQVEHAGDHAGALHRVRSSQGTELATSTLLVLDWSYFSGEAHLGYHQDTHLGARGALSTLRVVSWSEKAVDKARGFMGKPACTLQAGLPMDFLALSTAFSLRESTLSVLSAPWAPRWVS